MERSENARGVDPDDDQQGTGDDLNHDDSHDCDGDDDGCDVASRKTAVIEVSNMMAVVDCGLCCSLCPSTTIAIILTLCMILAVPVLAAYCCHHGQQTVARAFWLDGSSDA